MKKTLLMLIGAFISVLGVFAQAPNDYHKNADGKSGQALRAALESIICAHTQRTYGDLWNDFKSTDARADGKVWDMYSNATNFTFGTDQAGNYSKEGDKYNREHSFPNSWFLKDESSPMYTDLYHMYPTDGYVNNKRSNYPFGEVGSTTYTSANSFSKLGTASNSGYTGTVFEPNDEYKGDFARTYFYMVTCYASKVSSWNSDMLSSGDLSSWAIDLLLKWSKNDPISVKERNRIEAIYRIQGNRNPFIDCPGLEQYIWGANKNTPVNMTTLTGIINVPADSGTKYRINISGGILSIDAYADNTPIAIYDITGRTVVRASVSAGNHQYDLQKGIYLVGDKKFVVN